MAEYQVVLTRTAQKQLDKLSDLVAGPLLEAIQSLVQNPRPVGCKKLKGQGGAGFGGVNTELFTTYTMMC